MQTTSHYIITQWNKHAQHPKSLCQPVYICVDMEWFGKCPGNQLFSHGPRLNSVKGGRKASQLAPVKPAVKFTPPHWLSKEVINPILILKTSSILNSPIYIQISLNLLRTHGSWCWILGRIPDPIWPGLLMSIGIAATSISWIRHWLCTLLRRIEMSWMPCVSPHVMSHNCYVLLFNSKC